VEKILCQNKDIKTVCITSPTYAGVLSNIRDISRIVHAHGGKLFVDAAGGSTTFRLVIAFFVAILSSFMF
jgi:lysine decarboxylase